MLRSHARASLTAAQAELTPVFPWVVQRLVQDTSQLKQ
jgi:hypothetical protein